MNMRGFTLIEMIMAIVITGIIAGIVAVFIARPIEGYVDVANRAALTDMADLALKRMALEIRTAVPNTVRVGANYVEFIPARGGGRYCADTDTCANSLRHFTNPNGASGSATVSFDILGPAPPVSTNDQIVIYNTGQSGLDAYNTANNDNCATVTVVDADTLQVTRTPFPYASPSSRFFVVQNTGGNHSRGPVRFSCAGGSLNRTTGDRTYCGSIKPAATSALLVQTTTLNCSFQYDQASAANGLLTITLTLGNAGGAVTLMNQIHVDNLP